MDDFTKEIVLSMKDLSLSEESIEVEETLCMLLLSIKVNKLSRRELEEEEFEMQLLKEVKSILALVPLEDMRKLISGNFIHAIKVVMDLDFEKHLGKIPKLNVRRRPKNKKK